MTTAQILEQLGALSLAERLSVLETELHRIRQELAGQSLPNEAPSREALLAQAAEALRDDYASDEELTAFTALDDFDHDENGRMELYKIIVYNVFYLDPRPRAVFRAGELA